jgi:predicted Rdx family selenoprotein
MMIKNIMKIKKHNDDNDKKIWKHKRSGGYIDVRKLNKIERDKTIQTVKRRGVQEEER